AAELDLGSPAAAVGRLVAQAGEAGGHESGEGLLWSLRRIVARRFCFFADRTAHDGPGPPAGSRLLRAGGLFGFRLRSIAVPYLLRTARDLLHRAAADD